MMRSGQHIKYNEENDVITVTGIESGKKRLIMRYIIH